MLSKNELNRRLVALTNLLSEQAVKDTEFAAALSALFGLPEPSRDEDQTAMTSPKEPTLDPFTVRQESGEAGLRTWIDSQSIGQLKTIISAHRLDPTGNARKWKTKEKLVELIIDRVESRVKQGDVFRRYGEDAADDNGSPTATEEPNKAVNASGVPPRYL